MFQYRNNLSTILTNNNDTEIANAVFECGEHIVTSFMIYAHIRINELISDSFKK